MRRLTMVIATFWLALGLLDLITFFAGKRSGIPITGIFQTLGATLLLLRKPFGWGMLMGVSVVWMVIGAIGVMIALFAPESTFDLPNDSKYIWGIHFRVLIASGAALVSLMGTLSWLGLRRDRPADWTP